MTPFPVKTKSSEPMMILFTSGTNKYPKMVMHNHAYPLGHRITAELWHDLGPNDVHFAISDTGWGKNIWGNYFGQWNAGPAYSFMISAENFTLTKYCRFWRDTK